MNLKHILLTASFISFASFSAHAEEAKTVDNSNTEELPVNLTYAAVGGITINNDGLNKSLASFGYPAFPGNFTTLGTGTRTISGKIVTGGEGFFTMENRTLNSQNGHRGFSSTSFSMLGDVGYVIYSGHNLRIYPMIGAGLGRVFVDIFKDEKNLEYNALIKDPDKGISLASTNVLADLAIGADYTVGIGKSNPKKGGINIGLRAGYLFTLYSTGLQLKGEPIKNAPDINNNGLYLRLNIGYTNGIIPALFDIF